MKNTYTNVIINFPPDLLLPLHIFSFDFFSYVTNNLGKKKQKKKRFANLANCVIYWIVSYPVNSASHDLENWELVNV